MHITLYRILELTMPIPTIQHMAQRTMLMLIILSTLERIIPIDTIQEVQVGLTTPIVIILRAIIMAIHTAIIQDIIDVGTITDIIMVITTIITSIGITRRRCII